MVPKSYGQEWAPKPKPKPKKCEERNTTDGLLLAKGSPFVIDGSRRMHPSDSISVETGTFQGETAPLLADAFGSCVTIERSGRLVHAALKDVCAGFENESLAEIDLVID